MDEIISRAVKCNRQVCDYHSVEDYCLQHMSPMGRNTRLSIVCMNIRSIHRNLEEFCMDFNIPGSSTDIIGFTETWLNEYLQPVFIVPSYNCFRTRGGGTRGGGLALYIKNILCAREIYQFSVMTLPLESLFVKITWGIKPFLLGVIYRPPGILVEINLSMVSRICCVLLFSFIQNVQ